MKRRRLEAEKESWEEFEKRVGNKRNNAKKPGVGKVPSDILVQRMASAASRRLKKYEPLDTKDFVPFEDYEELNLENIKEACVKDFTMLQLDHVIFSHQTEVHQVRTDQRSQSILHPIS